MARKSLKEFALEHIGATLWVGFFVLLPLLFNLDKYTTFQGGAVYTIQLALQNCRILAIFLIGSLISKAIKKELDIKINAKFFICILVTIIGIAYMPMWFGCGNTQIGSVFEKSHYDEMYFVKASYIPASGIANNVFSGHAKISKSFDEIESSEHINYYTGEREESFRGQYQYHIEKIFPKNGHMIQIIDDDTIVPNVKKRFKTTEDEEYYVTLTTSIYGK